MDNAYLVAKYVADFERMEPRNIGIILWANGEVRTRFIDLEHVGVTVDDENYSRWVEYWQGLARQSRIQICARRPATRKTRRFLTEFKRTQRGNYLLDDGGEVTDTISDIDDAADFLFSRIVTSSTPREARRGDTLKQMCDRVFERIGLSSRDELRHLYPVCLHFGQVERSVRFHYAMASNGRPHRLFHRVNIAQEQSVTIAAGNFTWVTEEKICGKDACVSLYEAGEEESIAFEDTVEFLNYWSRALNVSSDSDVDTLRRLISV